MGGSCVCPMLSLPRRTADPLPWPPQCLATFSRSVLDLLPWRRTAKVNSEQYISMMRRSWRVKGVLTFRSLPFRVYLPSRSPSFYLPLYHVLTLSLSVSLFLSLFLSLIYRLCFSDRPTNNQATPSFVLLSFCTLMRSLSVSSSSTSLSSSTASPLLLSQIILIMYYI